MQITINIPDELPATIVQQYISTIEAQMSLLVKMAKGNTDENKQISLKHGSLKRTVGEYKNKIRISADFDEPLPDEFWLGE